MPANITLGGSNIWLQKFISPICGRASIKACLIKWKGYSTRPVCPLLLERKDLVALKLHFGEKGNTGYIRPQFLRRIVNKVKGLGGKPFLTDANTLYFGSRSNAFDHLQTAIENGFAYAVVDAPLIIADGLAGKDYINVEINRKHFKECENRSAAYHADAIIALTHFKGHEMTGFGGVLKNLGMGLGSRSGKQNMHSDVLPSVNPDKCTGCDRCSQWCPAEAIRIRERFPVSTRKNASAAVSAPSPARCMRLMLTGKPNLLQSRKK